MMLIRIKYYVLRFPRNAYIMQTTKTTSEANEEHGYSRLREKLFNKSPMVERKPKAHALSRDSSATGASVVLRGIRFIRTHSFAEKSMPLPPKDKTITKL
jgi:hypothetical protein